MKYNSIHRQYLKSDNTDWNAKAMTTAVGTYYSDPLSVRRSNGYAALFIISTAGSLAITQELSYDGKSWYTPYNTSGDSLGSIATALTVTTGKWIVFDPQIAEYMRIKVVCTVGNSSVSIIYMQQEG